MVNQIYPSEQCNNSYVEAPLLDLLLNISNGFVLAKFYDKRDDFGFNIINFQFVRCRGFSFAILRCLYFATNLLCKSVKSRH